MRFGRKGGKRKVDYREKPAKDNSKGSATGTHGRAGGRGRGDSLLTPPSPPPKFQIKVKKRNTGFTTNRFDSLKTNAQVQLDAGREIQGERGMIAART